MDKFADYKLQLAGLPVGNQVFNYVADAEFFEKMESSDIHSGLVNVALNVKNSGSCYILDFTFSGTIQITCDRCLEDMDYKVDTEYRLTVNIGEAGESDEDDVLTVSKDDREIDLSPYIYDSIELTIPIRHIHPAGQCDADMEAVLRRFSGEESEKDNDPRWDALRDLLDNK